MPERKPIFYDQERRRWRRTRVILEITGALFTLVLIVFLLNVVRNPELPDLLRPDTRLLHSIRSQPRIRPVRRGRKGKIAALGKVPQNYEPLRAAFYVSDDYTSLGFAPTALPRYRPFDSGSFACRIRGRPRRCRSRSQAFRFPSNSSRSETGFPS